VQRRNLKGPQDKVDRGRPWKMRQKSSLPRGATCRGGKVGSILLHVKFDLDFDVACSPGNSESFTAKSNDERDERGKARSRLAQSQM